MAKAPQKASPDAPGAEPVEAERECGIVMPISKTASHDARHWERVQVLLHRGVERAGLTPKNVWTGSAADRITLRILSNLFRVPIAVCDITDLNPNVMLELGMRLTSKKPTVVVAEMGSTIPFDIRDFEAVPYPADLNILDMEVFFDELETQLKEKLAAYKADKYQPFLADVGPIDVLEPTARAVPFESFVEERLEQIMARVEALDRRSSLGSPRQALGAPPASDQLRSFLVQAPMEDSARIHRILIGHPAVVGVRSVGDGEHYVDVGSEPVDQVVRSISAQFSSLGIAGKIRAIG